MVYDIYVHDNVGQRNVFTNNDNASYTIANGQDHGNKTRTTEYPAQAVVVGIIQYNRTCN